MRKPTDLAQVGFYKDHFMVYVMMGKTKILYHECETKDEVERALNGITYSLTGLSAKDYAEKWVKETS